MPLAMVYKPFKPISPGARCRLVHPSPVKKLMEKKLIPPPARVYKHIHPAARIYADRLMQMTWVEREKWRQWMTKPHTRQTIAWTGGS